jgi:mannose-1-phosphate guanylyltransferase
MINVILCGGSGTRLWPISRKYYPKQFCKLIDNESLFQKTVKRNHTLCKSSIIVTNQDQYFIALEQAKDLGVSIKTLLEPVGRNTAPAIALAALAADPEDILLVTPSDHLIEDEKSYQACLQQANALAQKDHLVTFGITPDYPETGYGYIEAEGENVLSFKEKPDEATAMKYISMNNYYWNSGIFCFKAKTFLDELKKHDPEILEKSKIAYKNAIKEPYIRISKKDMENIPANSIDYSVMESSDNVKVVPSNIGWNDLGSFDALEKISTATHKNEVSIDSKNNFIIAKDKKVISLIDINDVMVIDTEDALLICKKGSSQKIKELLAGAKECNNEITDLHTTAYRPWGSYTVLSDEESFKAKTIKVNPGQKLSLQRHKNRAEHWVVISGSARVTLDDKTLDLKRNDYVFIPKTSVHRMENTGTEIVEFAEVQIGDYFGEDDIERLEDDYNRS